jgi:DNA-binding NtrC family response regulator
MQESSVVMVVDDEPNMVKVLSSALKREGYEVVEAYDGEQALSLLEELYVDVILTDLKMPKIDGITLLKKALNMRSDLQVIILTAYGTVEKAIEAVKAGAFDFIPKPFELKELTSIVGKAIKTALLARGEPRFERRKTFDGAPEKPKDSFTDLRIVGSSPAMLQIYSLIEKVSDTPSTVLITGESGTGKELIAREIHARSRWVNKPFIKVNCAAIPRELLESELFGYEKGAFTGAVISKPGRFELAHGGTLFLDEIGEISLEMQVKLLRAVQDKEFERVGGLKTLKVDTRLITATNIDLKKAVEKGTFRDDLYYRLNVVNIHLPPLRERKEDIMPLSKYFLENFNMKFSKNVSEFSDEAVKFLLEYSWPGNIRELENYIERAVLFDSDGIVGIDDLPSEIRELPSTISLKEDEICDLKEVVKAETNKIEREYILKALELTGKNVTKAAQLLRISRKSLQIKMKELGIREELQK